jgi:hypothetical protein
MYNIPFHWIKFSNLVSGNDFKFYDWMSSTGFLQNPIYLNQITDNIIRNCYLPDLKIDLKRLKESCPF